MSEAFHLIGKFVVWVGGLTSLAALGALAVALGAPPSLAFVFEGAVMAHWNMAIWAPLRWPR